MPTKKILHLTRSGKKRKMIELESNAPIKKARLLFMKKLGSEYLNSQHNGKFWFNTFYEEQKIIYPWLKKEPLRWHIRRLNHVKKSLF